MKLAIFDLDNTLIGGDSDYLWGEFLAEQGHVDGAIRQQQNRHYYAEYKAGRLDIHDFLEFQLQPLAGVEPEILDQLREQYLEEKVQSILLDKSFKLIADHRQQGHTLLIITATNSFITQPIAELMGVSNLIASEAEMKDGRYTGKPIGIPSYAEGKVTRLNQWLKENNYQPEETWFYSDSHNDLPLLRIVDHPVAVDPDEILKKEAEILGWPIISLR
jgi:HAD superfamily hydrolase (TIGR01490 family)